MRISLDSAVAETFDDNEFLKLLNNFNIIATKQDIDEFVVSCVPRRDIRRSKLFFEERQTVN